MRYGVELIEAEFVARENRFAARVMVEGATERVHVPNPGRMAELLVPGATVLLLGADNPSRRTPFDLVVVETPSTRVSIDSRVPNTVLAEALDRGDVPPLRGYDEARREVTWGGSRFDFMLRGGRGSALVEVKGCTLVREDGLALFPDAPTTRGARHVRELTLALGEGMASFVVIIVQRDDGRVFAPNDTTDRAFGDALREADARGVEVLAFGTRVTRQGVELERAVPVDLTAALEET